MPILECSKTIIYFPNTGIQQIFQFTFSYYLMYDAECWPIKGVQFYKLIEAEMRMIRWIFSHTLTDKITNKVICEKGGIALIEDKMREARLIWFGHIIRRTSDAQARRCERIILADARRGIGRGRPKKK